MTESPKGSDARERVLRNDRGSGRASSPIRGGHREVSAPRVAPLFAAIAAVLAPGMCAAADVAYTSNTDDLIMWPNRGFFPAYEKEEPFRPIEVYASAELGADDNLFRLSEATPAIVVGASSKTDQFAFLGAGVRGALQFSQQQLRFDASVDHYAFRRFTLLNRWVYSGDLNWLWTVGDRLSGELGYSRSADLPSFAELQIITTDVVTTQYAHFRLDARVLPKLAFHGLAEGYQYDHDDPALEFLENRTKSGTAGLSFVTDNGGEIGVQYRGSQGDYPNPQRIANVLVDNSYREKEISGVIAKDFMGRSGVNIRVGRTERNHEQLPQRDFTGTTGRGQLRYAPTAKILLQVAAYRELEPIEDLTATYALVRGASAGPAWAPTLKLVFQGAYTYEERTFIGNPGIVLATTVPREDRNHLAQVAVGYRPNELVSLSFVFEHGKRTANVSQFDYDYNRGSARIIVSF